jgi:coenzyme F420-reducing hydrogenase delta subunit
MCDGSRSQAGSQARIIRVMESGRLDKDFT